MPPTSMPVQLILKHLISPVLNNQHNPNWVDLTSYQQDQHTHFLANWQTNSATGINYTKLLEQQTLYKIWHAGHLA